MSSRRILCGLACVLALCRTTGSQELDADPNRIFTTDFKWGRVAGAPHNEKLRHAQGTLVVLYLEGVYAEVTASFIKTNQKQPVSLNLNEGFIVRLGTWNRTDDDTLIRIESREVMREKQIQKLSCKAAAGDRVCTAMPEPSLPGPLISHTCRLERQSPTHIAETIVCNGGLVVSHQQKMLELADFPDMVRRLVLSQRRENFNK